MKVLNLLTACAIAAPLLFVSCNSDDTLTAPGSDAGGVSVSLTLGVAAGPDEALSRADDGKYYDMGLSGERKVDDALLVIYDRPINYAGDDGKVVKVLYLPSPLTFTVSTDKTDASYFDPVPAYFPQTDVLNQIIVGSTHLSDACRKEFKIDDNELELGKRYYAVALCNFGDMTSTFYKGMPLKDFRDYIYKGDLYTTNPGKIKEFSNFRMTGINECSFIWERKTDGSSLKLGDYLVQRLAARVDVSFGEAQKEFVNQKTYIKDDGKGDGYMQLAVYTLNETTGKYEIQRSETETVPGFPSIYMPKYSFYLTDLKIVNTVNNGTYLIERSSPYSPSYRDAKGNQAVPVYLDNEGWESYSDFKKRRATKYIFSPATTTNDYNEGYSLAKAAGYKTGDEPNLCALIKGGAFYNDKDDDGNDPGYYENKKNSAVVGYIPENTCSETNYTVLRVEGWTDATTSAIFTGSRALDTSKLTKVVGDIPIMHNTNADSHIMDYAVVRNTIYRLRIMILANDNKIYFRWYYIENGKSDQKKYEVAAFSVQVNDNNQNNPTIND